MKTKLKVSLLLLFVLTGLLGTGAIGCRHTAHGAGQDIERMGEKIQRKTD